MAKQRFLNQKLGKRASRKAGLHKAKLSVSSKWVPSAKRPSPPKPG